MTIKVAVFMDPIQVIDPNHDGTLALLLAAQAKGWQLFYFEQDDLYSDQGVIKANVASLQVARDTEFFQLGEPVSTALSEFDVVLLRKDPPFDMNYVYSTYLLELAEQQGTWVINKPSSVRDANEKMFTLWFAEHCPKTLVSANMKTLKEFWSTHGEVIFKPLDGMGGRAIFFAKRDEKNINVILETLTSYGKDYIMAQQFIPSIIDEGDKRIFIVNGQAMPYALQRLPAKGDFRGNMVAGATTDVLPLTKAEQKICQALGPTLQAKGLDFVGLDVIGGFVTEINVTSPTGMQEIERASDCDVAGSFIDYVEQSLKSKN